MGLFVHLADTDDLEKQMDKLLSDPGLLKRPAFNATYARERFTRNSFPPGWNKFLKTLFQVIATELKHLQPSTRIVSMKIFTI